MHFFGIYKASEISAMHVPERKSYLPVNTKIPLLDGRESHSEDEEDQSNSPQGNRANRKASNRGRKRWLVLWISIILNIILAGSTLGLWATFKRKLDSCLGRNGPEGLKNYYSVEEPYTPAQEAVEYELYKMTPSMKFQGEPSDKLDRAWKRIVGPAEGRIFLPKEEADKVGKNTLEYTGKPGHYVYGISMFHQLHCLDRIRKSFYPQRYFPGMSEDSIRAHRVHCIDMLRQHIMCAGNVQLNNWWNHEFDKTIVKTFPDGTEVEETVRSDYYNSLNVSERAVHSFVKWDLVHRCRNYDKLLEWSKDPVRMVAGE